MNAERSIESDVAIPFHLRRGVQSERCVCRGGDGSTTFTHGDFWSVEKSYVNDPSGLATCASRHTTSRRGKDDECLEQVRKTCGSEKLIFRFLPGREGHGESSRPVRAPSRTNRMFMKWVELSRSTTRRKDADECGVRGRVRGSN